MRDWFEALEQRERIIVAGGAVIVVVAMFWGLVWTPLDKRHDDLQSSVSQWEWTLPEMRTIAASPLVDPPGREPEIDRRSPVIIVDSTLQNRGLGQPKRSQPTPNGIRVEFEDVAFDDLVLWLGDLSTRYGMEVQSGSLSTSAVAGPGRINATLTLERTL